MPQDKVGHGGQNKCAPLRAASNNSIIPINHQVHWRSNAWSSTWYEGVRTAYKGKEKKRKTTAPAATFKLEVPSELVSDFALRDATLFGACLVRSLQVPFFASLTKKFAR